eukprot:403376203
MGESHLHRSQTLKSIERIKSTINSVRNREDINHDPSEEVKKYLQEKDLVKNLDTFEMKVAPTALHIFAENLNSRVKNMMFTTTPSQSQPFSKHLKILSTPKASVTSPKQQNQQQKRLGSQSNSQMYPKFNRREHSQANLNMNNLNLIMNDPHPSDGQKMEPEFERKERLKTLENDQQKLKQQQREIEKHMSMENNDLFSEEARKQLIKYKIYRPKSGMKNVSQFLLRQIKTTNMIATERQFDVQIQKEMPENLKDDEIVATQMDLYLTMNLNENLQKARLKRKKDRMMEALASKMTKIKGFVDETFKTKDIGERMKIEKEILQEYRQLQQNIEDLRVQRTKLLAINTLLHHQIQTLRSENKLFEEELKRTQLSSKSSLENKFRNMDRAHMIKDLVKLTAEKEQTERMKDEKRKQEQILNRERDQNSERIYYVEQEMEILKTQIMFLVNVQKEHYLRLLKEGTDTRQKGLLWIIQCLQCELEVPVILRDMMPSIIDDRSKEFIMELAQEDFKLNQMQQELQSLKQDQKNIIIKDSHRRNKFKNEESGFYTSRTNVSNQKHQITDKGFIPIKSGENFQKLMNLKNSTLKDIYLLREETKKSGNMLILQPQKTVTQIVEESNDQHAKAFGFESVRQQEQRSLFLHSSTIYNKKKGFKNHNKGSGNNSPLNRSSYLIQAKQIQQQIQDIDAKIKLQIQKIECMKNQEIRRLVKDYQNHYSELRKCLKSGKEDLRKLFMCLFGDTSWEVDFQKQLKNTESDKKQNWVQNNIENQTIRVE